MVRMGLGPAESPRSRLVAQQQLIPLSSLVLKPKFLRCPKRNHTSETENRASRSINCRPSLSVVASAALREFAFQRAASVPIGHIFLMRTIALRTCRPSPRVFVMGGAYCADFNTSGGIRHRGLVTGPRVVNSAASS